MEGFDNYYVLTDEISPMVKGQFYRCYFKPNSTTTDNLRRLSSEVSYFEDTISQVYVDSKRTILLRRRFDVSKKQSLNRCLIDIKKTKDEIHVTEVRSEQRMAEYLRRLNISYIFLEQAPIIEQFPFLRRNGTIGSVMFHLDERDNEIMVTMKMNDVSQWETITSLNSHGFCDFYADIKDVVPRSFSIEVVSLIKQWDESPFPDILVEQNVLREQYYSLQTEKERQNWEKSMKNVMMKQNSLPQQYVAVYEELFNRLDPSLNHDDDVNNY